MEVLISFSIDAIIIIDIKSYKGFLDNNANMMITAGDSKILQFEGE